MMHKTLRPTLLTAALLTAFPHARAQLQADDAAADAAHKVVVVGSRAAARSALDTAVPVGLVSARELASTGSLELGKALQELDPSFNFSTTFISDGTDIIRPATLRGLGPDQLLVLVNGKRRHQQALVNVQQTVGRGSAGTDINAIPMSAIHHIEVLRDGAAAQYGSDAIAGVINIVVKESPGKGGASVTGGTTAKGDGDTYGASAWHGFALGNAGGFLNLSVEARRRGETNRAGLDSLRVAPPRVTQRIGDSLARDAYLWTNAMLPLGQGELYLFGGASRRTGDAAGFFRPREDARNVPAVYPNGFLPNIRTEVRDASLAVGYRGDLGGGWKVDTSFNHGRSELVFNERNSINVSYWYENPCACASPREAYTGTLGFQQSTFNADLKGQVSFLGQPIFVATGFEYRRDSYRIEAGEPVSYQYGRTNNPALVIRDQHGGIAQAGIQGFPGYTPATQVYEGRHNTAFYVDLEHKWSEQLTLGSALRRERYSDFGNTTTGKLIARFDPSRAFGIRASASTGFRAPSVQQKFYSSVSTNLNNAGVLTETLTAREGSAVTRAFGIAPLKDETSRSASIGMVLRPVSHFSVTADLYRTDIDDRIVFSSTISPESTPASGICPTPDACPIRAILAPLRVGQAQFFTNAIDTRTLGLDVVAEHTTRNLAAGTLVLSGQLGINRTEVKARRSSSPVLSGAQLFDDAQVTLIERGQPRQHHVVAADYTRGAWGANLRANYYGQVRGQGFTAPFVQTWKAKWLVDLALRYAFTRSLSLTIGADNLFDRYPTRWDTTRAAPFPQMGFTHCWETCPFGVNGRTMYARAEYAF